MSIGTFTYGIGIASIALIGILLLLAAVWKMGEAYLQRERKKQKQL